MDAEPAVLVASELPYEFPLVARETRRNPNLVFIGPGLPSEDELEAKVSGINNLISFLPCTMPGRRGEPEDILDTESPHR